tara:strand:- start:499 stop:666 length:168 start_codon:yes stop_codon:yes gene_type:complete
MNLFEYIDSWEKAFAFWFFIVCLAFLGILLGMGIEKLGAYVFQDLLYPLLTQKGQ